LAGCLRAQTLEETASLSRLWNTGMKKLLILLLIFAALAAFVY
jgi:hypothetical protein